MRTPTDKTPAPHTRELLLHILLALKEMCDGLRCFARAIDKGLQFLFLLSCVYNASAQFSKTRARNH